MPARRPSPDASDHDLLIEIRTRLDVLQSSVRENNAAIGLRLDHLQTEKASTKDLDVVRAFIENVQRDGKTKDAAQDKDIRFAHRMIYIAIGALGVLEPLFLYWLMHPK